MKFKEREKIVDAVKFTRNNLDEAIQFTGSKIFNITIPRCPGGIMTADLLIDKSTTANLIEGVYIAKDFTDKLKVYNSSLFEALYEPTK